jgi:aminopeptidase N
MAVTDAPYYEAYRKAVYLNGAKFMEALRKRLGDETFFAFLRAYATQMTSRLATTNDFFDILHSQTDVDVSDLRAAYFKSR